MEEVSEIVGNARAVRLEELEREFANSVVERVNAYVERNLADASKITDNMTGKLCRLEST